MSKLTIRQQRFIKEFLSTGNATESARRAGYSTKTPNTTEVIAYEVLRNPQVRAAIDKALTKEELTPDWVLQQIRSIATNPDTRPEAQLKALELIGKHLRLFSDQSTNVYTNQLVIGFAPEPGKELPAGEYIDGEVVS